MRIIYVEDNHANLALIQRVARLGRHQVEHYTSGEQALQPILDNQPDLILVDIQLKGPMTGTDLVRLLREKGCTCPIIAVTAYAMLGDRERILEAGCTDYVAKPIPIGDLVKMFKSYSEAAAPPAAEE